MRTFVEKHKGTRQTKSATSAKPGRLFSRQSSEVSSILHLQKTIGNQAVQRLLQSNAEEFKAGLATNVSSRFAHNYSRFSIVWRVPREGEEEQLTKPDIPQVGPEGGKVPPKVESAINRSRGRGQPLDGAVQKKMSTSLGYDFRDVRVHTDSEADTLNRQLSAKAFTTGRDIFFKRGEYNPGTSSGLQLIAHELSHVVQQSSGRVRGGGGGMTVRPASDAFEQGARRVAMAATSPRNTSVQRQTPDEEEKEEEEIQTHISESQPRTDFEDLETHINSGRGSGQPHADTIHKPMEQAFKADSSDVRVHTDSEAEALNQQLSAKAFTTGPAIFLKRVEYERDLLALGRRVGNRAVQGLLVQGPNTGITASGREPTQTERSHPTQQSNRWELREGGGKSVRPFGHAEKARANVTPRRHIPHDIIGRGDNATPAHGKPDWNTGGRKETTASYGSVQRTVVIEDAVKPNTYKTPDDAQALTKRLSLTQAEDMTIVTELVVAPFIYDYRNEEEFCHDLKTRRAWGMEKPVTQMGGTKRCWYLSVLEGLRRAGLHGLILETLIPIVPNEAVKWLEDRPHWQRRVEHHLKEQLAIGPQTAATTVGGKRSAQLQRVMKSLLPEWTYTSTALVGGSPSGNEKIQNALQAHQKDKWFRPGTGVAILPTGDGVTIKFYTVDKPEHATFFVSIWGKNVTVYNQVKKGHEQLDLTVPPKDKSMKINYAIAHSFTTDVFVLSR